MMALFSFAILNLVLIVLSLIKSLLTGPVDETFLSFDQILTIHNKVYRDFSFLRESEFFKIFKVNFDNECNFHTQNLICQFPSCGICQCEDHEIPLPWKQEDSVLDQVDRKIDDSFYKWVEKYNVSTNYWLWEKEIESKNGIYVNLLKNIEAFTGYQGKHIWNAIYSENCFADQLNQICQEEKILYTIISGLHANINIHLSYNYLDFKHEVGLDNPSYKNITMLDDRVTKHHDRLNNLFFLYGTLLKTFYKAKDIIKSYEIKTMNNTDDLAVSEKIDEIYLSLSNYQEDLNKNDIIVDKLKNYQNIDKIRQRFRNISEIIDCVSCQKCKLHGKLQIYGLASTFKILFEDKKDTSKKLKENGNNSIKFRRNELISFVNLVDKVGRSIDHFLEMKKLFYEPLWLNILSKVFLGMFIIYFYMMLNICGYTFLMDQKIFGYNKSEDNVSIANDIGEILPKELVNKFDKSDKNNKKDSKKHK